MRGGLGIARGMQLADQPSNVEPALGVATSVTTEFRGKLPMHPVPEPQLMRFQPAGRRSRSGEVSDWAFRSPIESP